MPRSPVSRTPCQDETRLLQPTRELYLSTTPPRRVQLQVNVRDSTNQPLELA
jgi:hypothetical protein